MQQSFKTDIRAYEAMLRDAGYSIKRAKTIAATGFNAQGGTEGDNSVLDATILQLDQSEERIADILWGGHETKGYMANQVKVRFNTLKTSLTQAKAKGMTHKIWVTSGDNTRSSHAAANGQKVAIGANFNVGGKGLFLPCDPSAPFSETANCKCTVKYEKDVSVQAIKPSHSDDEDRGRPEVGNFEFLVPWTTWSPWKPIGVHGTAAEDYTLELKFILFSQMETIFNCEIEYVGVNGLKVESFMGPGAMSVTIPGNGWQEPKIRVGASGSSGVFVKCITSTKIL